MARPLNRDAKSCRKIMARREKLDRVDSSARFGFGDTAALASVSGPIEAARSGVELPEKAALEINLRPLYAVAGVAEKSICSALRASFKSAIVLNAHPRTLIQVVAQSLSPPFSKYKGTSPGGTVFDTNPSITAALINAGSLALLQAASIPAVGTVVAVAVGVKRISQKSEFIIDPEDIEVGDLVAGGVFAFLFSRSHAPLASTGQSEPDNEDFPKGRVVWSSWEGVFNATEYAKAEELARFAAAEILEIFRQTMSGANDVESMAVD
ncbi:hypothetical protein M408DRAFT_80398 [Serendipita vermifera MAFF 305830]|uniref:Exoribonuclease phosphorolytic domain-containing protein n=1 Tax=Serendipita vermifera MAFF 305830 TaxID=933852 RepID=A0A0C3AA68_SERVB|nr:hypothetical protein M408DRAFT_80398 [Serendipita vermifera MAFF 305830]